MICPKCGAECDCIEVDIGVGTMYGPPSCSQCGWSEEGIMDGILDNFYEEQ